MIVCGNVSSIVVLYIGPLYRPMNILPVEVIAIPLGLVRPLTIVVTAPPGAILDMLPPVKPLTYIDVVLSMVRPIG